MTMIAGLILAGGAATRLGGLSKAELRIGDRRLIDRVAGSLSPCRPILVAVGPVGSAPPSLPEGTEAIFDLTTDRIGPLGGLAAAVAFLGDRPQPPQFLLSVAVDTPFLPGDYLARLTETIGNAAAVIATSSGQPYPTNALWRLSALSDLPARLLAGTAPRAPRALAAELDAATCDWPAGPHGDPFANINTPEDRARAERIASEIAPE